MASQCGHHGRNGLRCSTMTNSDSKICFRHSKSHQTFPCIVKCGRYTRASHRICAQCLKPKSDAEESDTSSVITEAGSIETVDSSTETIKCGPFILEIS